MRLEGYLVFAVLLMVRSFGESSYREASRLFIDVRRISKCDVYRIRGKRMVLNLCSAAVAVHNRWRPNRTIVFGNIISTAELKEPEMSKLSRFMKRKKMAARRRIWKSFHDYSPNARTMFILGAQRSGTTILIKCLNENMQMEIFGEASRAMQDWRLREVSVVQSLIRESRCKAVVFKPLTESHRAHELMSLTKDPIICWVYRRATDRANSAVNRFGANNLEHLSAFVQGKMLDTWQAQGLSEQSLALLRKFDYSSMTPHSAAGLFWYVRNALFFEQSLDKESLVIPLAYEDLVANPTKVIGGLCRLLGCDFSEKMVQGIHSKSVGLSESRLAPEIEEICQEMYERLHEVQMGRWSQLGLD